MATAKKTRKTKKTSIQKDKANASDAIIVEEKAEEKSLVKDLLKKSTKLSKTDDSSNKRAEMIAMLSGESIENVLNKKQNETKNTIESKKQVQEVVASQSQQISVSSRAEELLLELVKEIVPENKKSEFISKINSTSLQVAKKSYAVPKRTKGDTFLIHWNGRFGNRMHTYAYLWNRAKMFGGDVYLPSDWEGARLFNLDYKIIEDDDLRLAINQTMEPYDSLDHRLKEVQKFSDKSEFNIQYCNPDNPTETYKDYKSAVSIDSVCAYHTEIFKHMKLADILKVYEFSDEVKNLDIYKKLEDKQGTYDIAHLRRDDIANVNYQQNGGYSVISKEAYLKAFKKYDYDPDKIEWTSDDWTNKWGVGNAIEQGTISKRGSWGYPIGSEYLPEIIFDWLPDFLRIYFARSIFRANSSFSFWACTLAKGRETPPKIFAPRLDKRVLYAKKETYEQETEFNFEEGNHPHWLCIKGKDQCDDILFSDEKLPS
jgi:hypothetical protein